MTVDVAAEGGTVAVDVVAVGVRGAVGVGWGVVELLADGLEMILPLASRKVPACREQHSRSLLQQ